MHSGHNVDWSVADDPAFDLPDPPSPPSGLPWWRRLPPRRTVVLALSGLALAAVVGVAVQHWQQQQLLDEIRAVVSAEDEAALAGAHPLSMGSVGTPLAVSSLRVFGEPRPEVGQVMAIDRLTADTLRVLVRRRISDANGVQGTWAESQWYENTTDGWRRAGSDHAHYDLTEHHAGHYADWTYSPLDVAYVREFAPVVDQLVSDICTQAACPDGLRLGLRFSIRISPSANDNWSARFGLAQYPDQVEIGPFSLYRLSPLIRGMPLDDTARAHERRWLERVAIVGVQHRLWTLERVSGNREIAQLIHQALWSRVADRRGLDPVAAASWVLPDPRLPTLTTWSSAGGDGRFSPDEAQVLVNRLLSGVDLDTERRLLDLLPASTDPVGWLADGLRVDPATATSLWQAAAAPQSVTLQTERAGDFLVQCGQEWAGALRGEALAIPFTAPRLVVPGTDAAWSPNGDRLVTSNGVLYDFGRGTVSALGDVDEEHWELPLWIDNDRFFVVSQLALDEGARLYTLNGGQPPSVDDYPTLQTILISPDRRWLAVIVARRLMIQSVHDPIGAGTVIGITGEFYQPGLLAWSADSRRLAFISHHPGQPGPTASAWATVAEDRSFVTGTLAALDDWLLADRLRRFEQVSFDADPDTLILTAVNQDGQTSVFRYAVSGNILLDDTFAWMRSTAFYPVDGFGLLAWNSDARQLSIVGLTERSPQTLPGSEPFLGDLRYDALTDTLILATSAQRFVWLHPADPASGLERVDLPCPAIAANPAR